MPANRREGLKSSPYASRNSIGQSRAGEDWQRNEVTMGKIDNQLLNLYKQYTACNSQDGKTISPDEAYYMLRRADQINNLETNSCINSKSKKGNKDLKKLVEEKPDNFSPAARSMIDQFCRTGKLPTQDGMVGFAAAQGCADVAPKAKCAPEVTKTSESSSTTISMTSAAFSGRPPLPTAPNMGMNAAFMPRPNNGPMVTNPVPPAAFTPRPNASPVANTPVVAAAFAPGPNAGPVANAPVMAGAFAPLPSVPTSINPGPALPPLPMPASAPRAATNPFLNPATAPVNPAPTPAAPALSTPATPIAPLNNARPASSSGAHYLEFKANTPVWPGHWWPIQERVPGGRPDTNLWAVGGPLDKLDKLTHKGARDYEFAHHRKSMGAGSNFGWWGNCDKAAQVACCFKQPKRPVTMNGVTFTPLDTQGLLVLMSDSMITKVDFKGTRFNDGSRDDPKEPRPAFFLQVMKEWEKDGLAFCCDIDDKAMVWNYPFDNVIIDEFSQPPAGVTAVSGQGVKYYDVRMSGTGYPKQARHLIGYVQYDGAGNPVTSDWIKTQNTDNNIDFMWRPHAMDDLYNKANWQLRRTPSNPNIDPQLIYDIYMQSL
jgi:hypothetical protein